MTVGFVIGFAVFLVLMAGLFVAVVRFVIKQGRRLPSSGDSPTHGQPPEADGS
ncbi:MAG: hypothetical protein ABSD85_13105 [Acidimicrobiales bacterium]